MNTNRFRIIAGAVTGAIVAAAIAAPGLALAGAKPYQKIKTPKLRDIVAPQVQRVTLDNGLQVFMIEDHELPLFRLTLTMKAGTAFDPAGKIGLAEVTADVLRSGGSEVVPGDHMDEVLENMGGAIETSASELTTTVSVNVLVEDMDKSLAMLRDLLLLPAYPADKIDLELKQARSGIARRNDDPSGIASREMDKLLFGAEHPFARQMEYEDLAHMTRDDLVAFHQKYYHPQDAYLAVWGDFDAKQAIERVRNVLGEWPKVAVAYPEIPPVPATTPSLDLVVKESVNQSNIAMGHRGTTQKDPDYYALSVMNEVLGGGFGSRLFSEVRSRQGLSYNVGSSLGAGLQYPGMFMVSCGTKSETTVKAVQACIDEVRKMKTQSITPEELQRAKESILNSYVFNFTNKGAIVNRQINYVRNGYPADFLEQFAKRIEAVSIDQVKAAAGKYLQPDQFAVLVVGKAADFGAPLTSLGKVDTIDVTIPEPAVVEEYPVATPETLAKGKTVLAEATKALGGGDALRKLTNITEQQSLTLSVMGQTIPGKLTRYRQYPGNTRQEIEVMGQKMVEVFSGPANTGFQMAGPRAKDFDPSDIADAKDQVAQDFLAYLRDPDSYSPQWIGAEPVNGAATDVVLMSPVGGKKFKVFVDKASRLVVKQEGRSKNMQGAPVRSETFYEGFKKVGALLLPHKVSIVQDGQPFLSAETTSLTTDAIPADKFKKSAG